MNIYLNLDAPLIKQFGFQDPSTITFNAISDLHNDIMTIESLILGLVTLIMGVTIYSSFTNYSNNLTNLKGLASTNPFVTLQNNVIHNTQLEII
jgi:hypothetical protein